jgi:hypothetical protein
MYWREKEKDPEPHYSYRFSKKEIALSDMNEDVKVVVRASFAGPECPMKAARVADLSKEYTPMDFQFCPLKLEWASTEDWNGR